MIWTEQIAELLTDAPWPMTKAELIDFVERTSGNSILLDNFAELEDDGEEYDSILELWTDYDSCSGFPNYEEEYF